MGNLVFEDLVDIPLDKGVALPVGEALSFLVEEFDRFLADLDC
jgi:hypothetical protein